MSELQLKELGHRLTGLNVTFNKNEYTVLRLHDWELEMVWRININFDQLEEEGTELEKRGFIKEHLKIQALLHEIAHFRQFSKRCKKNILFWDSWYSANRKKAEGIADRYALMYYRRFL